MTDNALGQLFSDLSGTFRDLADVCIPERFRLKRFELFERRI
jgi:hypothetical protein